jgi:hypothetical protein
MLPGTILDRIAMFVHWTDWRNETHTATALTDWHLLSSVDILVTTTTSARQHQQKKSRRMTTIPSVRVLMIHQQLHSTVFHSILSFVLAARQSGWWWTTECDLKDDCRTNCDDVVTYADLYQDKCQIILIWPSRKVCPCNRPDFQTILLLVISTGLDALVRSSTGYVAN